MLITIYKERENALGGFKSTIKAPNTEAMRVVGNITLSGTTLNSITISRDGGYRYEEMVCNAEYSGDLLIKSDLYSLKGYSLMSADSANVSGLLSDFNVSKIGDNVDVSMLVIDVDELNSTFSGTNLKNGPIFINKPYVFEKSFYDCKDLLQLDFSRISNENLQRSKFIEFCPTTTDLKFAEDVDPELKKYISSQRHKEL